VIVAAPAVAVVPAPAVAARMGKRLALTVAVAAVGAGMAGCGADRQAGDSRAAVPQDGGSIAARAGQQGSLGTAAVQIVALLSLSARAGAVVRSLPGGPWVVSFDVRLAPDSRLAVRLGSGASTLRLGRGGGAPLRYTDASRGHAYTLSARPGFSRGGWHHVEATNGHLSIDGRALPIASRSAAGTTSEGSAAATTSAGSAAGQSIDLRASRGHADVGALIISAGSDRGSLLLHRLAELHARIPAGQYPIGADVADRIHYGSTYWTSGFWPGALWQAAAIAPADGMFARWALQATIEHFGQERADTHDVGFTYGESSLAAWRARCEGRGGSSPAGGGRSPAGGDPASRPALCARLKASVLGAADELLALARSNPGAGTIPTDSRSREGDTIIDSTMNIAILPWASRVTGDPAYASLASHHAHVVASWLVRPDGSTAQAVNFDRATGRVLSITTHQGLSDASTWSRGQGWAVYGFAQAAAELKDRGLLAVAVRAAGYVQRHLPAGGIPLWDYDAPPGAPVDVSAGVITAAGLMRLAAACRAIPGVCGDSAGRWVSLGRRMLAAALGRERDHPPLGFLGSQVLNERGRGCWCDGGELSFGLTYALEAMGLERATRR